MAYSDFRFVEIAKYVPKINAVIREKRNDQAVMLPYDELDEFRKKHKNTGVYTSIFRYSSPDLDSPRISPLYFDIDSEDLSKSYQDVKILYKNMITIVSSEMVHVYFSGSKGFHVEVDATALGASFSMNLPVVYRAIAEQFRDDFGITTFDFGVYEPRRMWRLPNSRHQKTGLFKVELLEDELLSSLENIKEIAQSPRDFVSKPCTFNPVANSWLKSWVIVIEGRQERQRKNSLQRRLDMFNKYGTSVLDGPSKKYVKKVWESAIRALRDTEPDKNRNVTLSRQAYRLYITALEADMDIEDVTNKLYDIGLDIGLEDREVRATLKSALRGAKRKHEEEGVTV